MYRGAFVAFTKGSVFLCLLGRMLLVGLLQGCSADSASLTLPMPLIPATVAEYPDANDEPVVRKIAPASAYSFIAVPSRLHTDMQRAVRRAGWAMMHIKPNTWRNQADLPRVDAPVTLRAMLPDNRIADVVAWAKDSRHRSADSNFTSPGHSVKVNRSENTEKSADGGRAATIVVAVRVGFFGDTKMQKFYATHLASVMADKAKPLRYKLFRLPEIKLGELDIPFPKFNKQSPAEKTGK